MTQLEEVGGAVYKGGRRAHLIKQAAAEIPARHQRCEADRPVEQRIGGDFLPEVAQLGHAVLRRVPGDQGRVDRADRNSGHPVGMQIRLCESLVDTSLIGTERTTALQQQGNAFEGRTPARPLILQPS